MTASYLVFFVITVYILGGQEYIIHFIYIIKIQKTNIQLLDKNFKFK